MSKISKNDYMSAMIKSPSSSNKITSLLKNALTNEINNREMFMKNIDGLNFLIKNWLIIVYKL